VVYAGLFVCMRPRHFCISAQPQHSHLRELSEGKLILSRGRSTPTWHDKPDSYCNTPVQCWRGTSMPTVLPQVCWHSATYSLNSWLSSLSFWTSREAACWLRICSANVAVRASRSAAAAAFICLVASAYDHMPEGKCKSPRSPRDAIEVR
jgi:hypothetical protein